MISIVLRRPIRLHRRRRRNVVADHQAAVLGGVSEAVDGDSSAGVGRELADRLGAVSRGGD